MDRASTRPLPKAGTYVTGFVLAVLLTAIPFAIVAFKLLPSMPALLVIAVAAIVQIGVHLRF